jgi:DNA-directed RNA polymerase III subunit RPC3
MCVPASSCGKDPSPTPHPAKAAYAQALHKLVASHYLKPSTVLSHISPRDKIYQYEAEEKAKMPGIPAAKELREARVAAEARFMREEDDAERIGMVSAPALLLRALVSFIQCT